jgi:hypothetical protein
VFKKFGHIESDDDLLTFQEAADTVACSVAFINLHIKKKEIVVTLAGAKPKIRRGDFKDFFEKYVAVRMKFHNTPVGDVK